MCFSTDKKNQYKQIGQSLVEILLAMGVFVLAVSAGAFFVLDIYLSAKLGREVTVASFLAKEGLEAVRSIRDNGWDNLIEGDHGLAIVNNSWALAGLHEDVSSYLANGTRKIILENVDADRKKVTSIISWNLTEDRPQEIYYVSLLTNWVKVGPESQDCNIYCQSLNYVEGLCRANPGQCGSHGEIHEPEGDQYCTYEKQDTCCCLP